MRKSLFLPGSNPLLRLLFFISLSLALLYLDHRHQIDPLRNTLATAVYPLQVVIDLPTRATTWVRDAIANHAKLIEQNTRLRAENIKLSARLRSLDSLKYENTTLQQLLRNAKTLDYDYTLGRLLAVSMTPARQRVIIDKGSRDGVLPGVPILDGLGLMGEVTRVYPYHSEAILISDPGAAIPVRIARNGLRAILVGTGSTQTMKLLYLPITADIRTGDTLVTSGLGGRYPADLPVATIDHVGDTSQTAFADAQARPLAALDQSRSVLVIKQRTTPAISTQPAPDNQE